MRDRAGEVFGLDPILENIAVMKAEIFTAAHPAGSIFKTDNRVYHPQIDLSGDR